MVLSLGRGQQTSAPIQNIYIISIHQYLFSRLRLLKAYILKANVPPSLEFSSNSAFYTGKGFRKVDPDNWEFAHEGFLRGQRHLLKNISRRKTHYSNSQTSNQSPGSSVEVKCFGFDAEIDRLSFDNQVLATEIANHRQKQQTTLSWLRTMEHRLQGAEMKHKQTVSLLVKAIQNPTLLQQKDKNNEPEDVVSNKRRRRIPDHVSKNIGVEEVVFQVGDNANLSTIGFQEIGHGSMENAYKDDVEIGQFGGGNFCIELKPQEYGELIPRFGDSGLENMALSMKRPEVIIEEKSLEDGEYNPIDERFWEELMNEGIEEIGTLGIEEGGDMIIWMSTWDSWVQT